MKTHWLLVFFGVLLVLMLSACSTKNVGSLDSGSLADNRDVAAISLEDFDVVRCDAGGRFDPSLESTIGLRLDGKSLVISIEDTEITNGVALEVRYDAEKMHAEGVEYHEILGESTEIITGSFLNMDGTSGIGQVAVNDDYPEVLNGDFATLNFVLGPNRNVSSQGPGPHDGTGGLGLALYPEGENLANVTAVGDDGAKTVTITWYGSWHLGDNNQDKLVTIGDITEIGAFWNQLKDASWAAVRADSDRNGMVNITDLTQIGGFYNRGTDGYLVEVSDDVDGAVRTEIGDYLWDAPEMTPFSLPADVVADQMETAFNMWQVVIGEASAPVNYAALAALDTAGVADTVRFWISPYYATDMSADGPAFVDVNVTGGGGGDEDYIVIVQDFEVQIAGADGGIGAGNDLFNDANTEATAGVNTDVTFTLSSVSGTFEAVPFDGTDLGNLPGEMTEALYDEIFAAVRDSLDWAMTTQGAAGFRRTTDVVSGTWPATGDPVGARTIFPDDDPESSGASAEAALTVTMPNVANQDMGAWQLNQVSMALNIGFDATVDPAAAVIDSYGFGEFPVTELILNQANQFPVMIGWGAAGEPADLSTTQVELHEIDANGIATMNETLVYTEVQIPEEGEFSISTELDPEIMVMVHLTSTGLSADSNYAFRFSDGTTWSSINKPPEMLITAPAPPPQDLEVIPDSFIPDIDILQVFYSDPLVRRNPGMSYIPPSIEDPIGHWENDDDAGFNDVLKNSGDQFFLGANGVWPDIAMQEAASPAGIQSMADDEVAGIVILERNPGRMAVNVSSVTYEGFPGDPNRDYAFKFFNEDGTPVGQGVFTVAPMGVFSSQPLGKNWGVNIFDDMERGELEFGDRNFDATAIVGGHAIPEHPTPDVLWFEISGGWMFDWVQPADEAYVTPDFTVSNNLLVRATDTENSEDFYMSMSLRVIGITAEGDYLAIHVVTANDFDKAGAPGWAGRFDPGRSYWLELDDKHWAGIEYSYPLTKPLTVTGINPNDM